MNTSSLDKRLSFLLTPAAYPHAVSQIELVETHISWVLLTGSFAYKIKKPVRFDFLDFSTLELREHACQRELQINQQFAPTLYCGVVAITSTENGGQIDGTGPVIEYAVKMHQFDQSALLSELLARSRASAAIPVAQMDDLARRLAEYHAHAKVAEPPSPWTDIQRVRTPARENFRFLLEHVADDEAHSTLAHLEAWTEDELLVRAEDFPLRANQGYVRECHGDLHLGNILWLPSGFVAFDAIEFNDSFRWIDVMNDLAFPLVELDDYGHTQHARRLLNQYLETTGDYLGLTILPFYMVYRALVKTKVDLIQARQSTQAPSAIPLRQSGLEYLRHAVKYSSMRRYPRLWITHGLSGSGKSTATLKLVEKDGFVRLRSDVIRKQLNGLDPYQNVAGPLAKSLYSPQSTAQVYGRLLELAEQIVETGFSVIIDATFLLREQRDAFRKLAHRTGAEFRIADCQAPREMLLQRLEQRGPDPSDANAEVLERQFLSVEALTDEERPLTIRM